MDWTLDIGTSSSARFAARGSIIRYGSTSWNPHTTTIRTTRGAHHDDQDDYQDIDLDALSDDELVEQMHNDLYDGMKDEIVQGTNILLERGFTATKVLDDALVAGMKIVGIDFRDGILFVPEVLLAANAMKAGMAILRPLLAETGAEPVGKVVIGTVKGDIHDIGKNLVGMMLEGAGFEVVDLGINTDADKFIDALDRAQAGHPRMSALLTTTMPYMKVVIQTLKDRGMRDDYIVLVGGAPLNEEFGMAVGADAYCRDAGVAAETARRLDRRATCPEPRPGVPPTADAARRGPRRRLRCARPRARRADPRPARTSTSPACRRPCTTGPAASPPRFASASAGARGRLRPRLRRLRRLRHGRPARPGHRRGGRRAARRRPLLRVLRDRRGVRPARRRGAGDVLPDRLPGPQLRPARHQRAWGSTGTRSCATVLRQLPASRLPRPDRRPGAGRSSPAAPRGGSASRSSVARRATASSGRRSRPSPQAGRPQVDLGARLIGGHDDVATMTVIWWRDIPAQVTASEGRRQSKIVLHPRFQVAIDKAASRAGKRAYNDYIEEWRRTQQRCGDDIEAEVAAEAERLEADYDKHRLAS